MPNITLHKLNPSQDIKPYRMIVFVGKKGSGKSTLMKDIFYHLRDRFDLVVALAGTRPAEEMFKEFIPDAFVYNTIDTSVAEKLVQYARIMVEHGKKRNVLLLMDDCLGNTGTKDKMPLEHPVFRDIAFNQRHLNLTFAVSLQYCMAIKPNLRTQVDYAFVLQDTNWDNRRKLHQYFFGMFENLEGFTKCLEACTSDYGCLVFDNVKCTGRFEDNLYYYKASTDIPEYKLGKEEFWYLSRLYKPPTHSADGDLFGELVRNLDVTRRQNTKDSRQDRLVISKI